ncbi:hypothetical protein PG997_003580 [Apiospora hydei]|uniref:Uncharacterized protein n=1 Tax=Apiospora hydei TaxID=1337664 RepID=A0ABR1WZS6_9PEZI
MSSKRRPSSSVPGRRRVHPRCDAFLQETREPVDGFHIFGGDDCIASSGLSVVAAADKVYLSFQRVHYGHGIVLIRLIIIRRLQEFRVGPVVQEAEHAGPLLIPYSVPQGHELFIVLEIQQDVVLEEVRKDQVDILGSPRSNRAADDIFRFCRQEAEQVRDRPLFGPLPAHLAFSLFVVLAGASRIKRHRQELLRALLAQQQRPVVAIIAIVAFGAPAVIEDVFGEVKPLVPEKVPRAELFKILPAQARQSHQVLRVA